MRLIDADVLMQKIETYLPTFSINPSKIIELVENAPTVERPHGKWKVRKAYTDDGYEDGHELYCSICGETLMTLCNRSITAEEARKAMKHHIDENKYCFNCGADMREGEEK